MVCPFLSLCHPFVLLMCGIGTIYFVYVQLIPYALQYTSLFTIHSILLALNILQTLVSGVVSIPYCFRLSRFRSHTLHILVLLRETRACRVHSNVRLHNWTSILRSCSKRLFQFNTHSHFSIPSQPPRCCTTRRCLLG